MAAVIATKATLKSRRAFTAGRGAGALVRRLFTAKRRRIAHAVVRLRHDVPQQDAFDQRRICAAVLAGRQFLQLRFAVLGRPVHVAPVRRRRARPLPCPAGTAAPAAGSGASSLVARLFARLFARLRLRRIAAERRLGLGLWRLDRPATGLRRPGLRRLERQPGLERAVLRLPLGTPLRDLGRPVPVVPAG